MSTRSLATDVRFILGIPLIGSCGTILLYWPTVHFGFLFDDVPNIMKFYAIRSATFRELFFSRSRWLSAWLNTMHYSIGKFEPFSYRLFNIIMHAAAGTLVFFIFFLALRRSTQSSFFSRHHLSIASITALLFLLHPVQTQTITYVVQGQLEGLAGFFILSMILTFLLLCDAQSKTGSLLGYIILYVLALFSVGTKEIAIISPLLLLLVDWFFVAHGEIKDLQKRFLVHATIMVIVWGGYLYLLKPAFFAQLFGLKMTAINNFGNQLTEHRSDAITPFHFFISQFKVILHYLWIFIWPFNISIDYDEKLVSSFFAPNCLGPLTILLGILSASWCLLMKNKHHLVPFAIGWFFIAILPRSSIIPSSELIADYKTYTASVGVCFLLASLLIACTNFITQTTWAQLIMGLFLVGGLGRATYERNKVWESGEKLWENVMQQAPNRARAFNNYGAALIRSKKYQEAIPYLRKALELDPQYPDALCNLGLAYNGLDQPKEAFKYIARALKLQRNPENYLNLATTLIKLELFEDAADLCIGAIEKHRVLRGSEYGKAWYNLGRCYEKLGKDEDAWQALKTACTQADMDNEVGYRAFGEKSLALKKYEDALWSFTKALQENSNSYANMFNVAYAKHKNNQHAEAAEIFEYLLKLTPNDRGVLQGLSHVYIALNEHEKAYEMISRLMKLDGKDI